jgi:hypothetical protein
MAWLSPLMGLTLAHFGEAAALVSALLEQIADRDQRLRILRAQLRDILHSAGSTAPGVPCGRIEDPDVGDTESEVVFHPLAHFRKTIVRREDLDTNEGRSPDDLIRRLDYDQTNVWNAKARRQDLNALFYEGPEPPLLPVRPVIECDLRLQPGMILLAQVALQNHPVDVVAIRAVAGAQIFVDAYQ